MNRPGKCGFTLVELLVVLAMAALLAAVLIPYLQRVYAVQRRITCANHLEKLGQAYSTRAVEHKAISIFGWQSALMRYVGNTPEVFLCPEDRQPGVIDAAGGLQIAVYRGSCDNPGDWLWDVPLDEEECPWVWKLSQEQWDRFYGPGGPNPSYRHGGYVAGADPTRYYFTIEDQGFLGGGDRDFYDQMLQVREVEGETMELTPIRGQAGFNFNLVQGVHPDQQEILHDMKRWHWELAAAIPMGRSESSYGLNAVANRIPRAKRRILLLDYEIPVAHGSDEDPHVLDDWSSEKLNDAELFRPAGPATFARHLGKINVLYGDGSVVLVAPDRIDPGLLAAHRARYWNPNP